MYIRTQSRFGGAQLVFNKNKWWSWLYDEISHTLVFLPNKLGALGRYPLWIRKRIDWNDLIMFFIRLDNCYLLSFGKECFHWYRDIYVRGQAETLPIFLRGINGMYFKLLLLIFSHYKITNECCFKFPHTNTWILNVNIYFNVTVNS